ncbi:hypothetical protein J6TS1_06630 [Siminovitchia terrae]|uniref:CN hydrolase domain-containing protein n=1 Tax=Siminovitchia terrae TaxID=1914933 RepID=A0ABQ4KRY8_SIMTE|nr:carbon-nitrogen hydrolase family protein [Siminovitchia terrae]GIN94793.1 hypothetical protein J6TS1_06630 [Siminovitchia terrae]
MSTEYLNIAMVQIASFSNQENPKDKIKENFTKMEEYIDAIAHSNPAVNMIVFPEFYLNGSLKNKTDYLVAAENIPGPLTDILSKKAKEHGIWLVPGSIIEKDNESKDKTYNTAMLISPEGEIVMKYRKVFIPYPLELSESGSTFPVYEIPNIGKIGFLICADHHFPEAARNLALNGAEIIIKPTLQGNWIGGLRNHSPFAMARAVENQCFFVSVNQPSPVGMGDSVAYDPEGRVLEQLGSTEAWTVVNINLDEVRRVREMGFAGMFGFLKMLKEIKEAGHEIDHCYQRGISNAPVYQTLKYPNPKTPSEIKKLW